MKLFHGLTTPALVLAFSFGATFVTAQTTRTEQIVDEKEAKAAAVAPEQRETGDLIITKLEAIFAPEPPAVNLTFGEFRPGAGLGLGLGYSRRVSGRGLWSTSAAYSTERFKQVETALDLPPFQTDRVHIHAFARWDDSPELAFFGRGIDASRSGDVTYGLRTGETGAELRLTAGRWFNYGAGAGYLQARSTDGAGSAPVIGSVPAGPGTAGVGSSPAWLHTQAYVAVDSRTAPGYTDAGGLYSLAFHHYADGDGAFGFSRTEIDLRQFIPVLHHNWVIALQARADLTHADQGQQVPFFMLPSIGGRDTLPGFENYRFTDNDSLLLRSELRWTPTSLVDTAIFLDQGTVSPTVGAFDLDTLERSWGFGFRFHGPTFTALRLELAHSVEGWHYNIAHTVSF